jgi:carbamoyl-phosphate synthase small subunit
MKALLALENGMVFKGESFGADVECMGEVVFNTSMSGYQEILTDPSYAGQVVCLTYPEIGNYGVNIEDRESARVQVSGFIVKNLCPEPSNYRSDSRSLEQYLIDHQIPGIKGIDTRKLVRVLRSSGAMRGVICSAAITEKEAIEKARNVKSMVGADLASEVTCQKNFTWFESPHVLQHYIPSDPTQVKIVAVDFGVKFNTLRRLKGLPAEITVVPARTTAEEILAMEPDGVYLSNGPGDPEAVTYGIETVRKLIGKVPVFGICLGHQILALALGGKTFKLKFGHRGANHPIKNLRTEKVEITAQNHGFAVQPGTLPEDLVEVTHINLNDNTIAGLRHKTLPVFSVQYHPEASPGPHDSYYLFEEFARNAKEFKRNRKKLGA